LTPDTEDFWGQCRGTPWNETCLYCHNTEPSKNPIRGSRGEFFGFQTTTRELGIACAACHGPGDQHVRLQSGKPAGENDVVQPANLSVARRDEICARCHGALVPKPAYWDPITHRDPFIPGKELTQFNSFFWSEAEQATLAGRRPKSDRPLKPEANDGRFWGDGTPLTTALEYNGMALSACYQKGNGQLSCLSCHTMHGDDPNFMLKPRMNTNDACYQCHAEYRTRLAEHTRHAADSPGSLCYNCHMPHQVYSLLNTHRSHRIQIPDLASSVGTGKPHACNLCHLDKSLGWTRDELAKWPNGQKSKGLKLSADQESLSEAVLLMSQADARTRVVVAGAFSNPAAHKASGHDWYGSMLTRLLDDERYPAVRYLGHRGLRIACGEAQSSPYDYLATALDRSRQLAALRSRFDMTPVARPLPFVPLTESGLPDQALIDRLRKSRHDPDISIHE
jgi:predicted CXXCH cytochrome family protein